MKKTAENDIKATEISKNRMFNQIERCKMDLQKDPYPQINLY